MLCLNSALYCENLLFMSTSSPASDSPISFSVPRPFNLDSAQSNLDIRLVVIKSSDGHSFYVLRDVLSVLFPVFADMFALGSQDQSSNAPADAIPLSELGHDLYRLLTWCDPRCSPIMGSMTDIVVTLSIADKYDLAVIVAAISLTLEMKTAIIAENPIAVYALAIRYHWEGLARKAARESLRIPVPLRRANPELNLISGMAVQYLNEYFYACVDAATALLNPPAVFPADITLLSNQAGPSAVIASYVETIRVKLGDCPTGDTVEKLDFHEIAVCWNEIRRVDQAGNPYIGHRNDFRKSLAKHIQDAVDKV